jgi:hypothetical protein
VREEGNRVKEKYVSRSEKDFHPCRLSISWAVQVARMGEDRGVHRVLVGKPEGKRPLGRPRLRWEDNIKKDV